MLWRVVRKIPAERFVQLIEVATKVFVTRGYRLTQMSDVAEALGVAKGTLYGYVESKEALFDAAVRFADGQTALPVPSDLPVPTPAPGSTLQYIQKRLMEEAGQLELVRALSRPKDAPAPEGEFASIVLDFYRRMAKNRRALKLVDRCAIDHPGLAAVWFEQGRYGQVALLATYLEQRGAGACMRSASTIQCRDEAAESARTYSIELPVIACPSRDLSSLRSEETRRQRGRTGAVS